MKKLEVNEIYTRKVAEYINKGYVINVTSMSGSQGEEAKVDFIIDSETVIRVRVEYKWGSIFTDCGKTLEIIVEKHTGKNITSWDIIWNGHGVEVEKIVFVEINKDWYVTEEESKEIAAKRKERYRNKETKEVFKKIESEEAKKIVLRYARKQKGCKTATIKDIEGIIKRSDRNGDHIRYAYTCRGKDYRLSANN